MKIILVGCGKVGRALARQLSEEKHNVTVIDTNPEKIEAITEELDVLGVTGNGASNAILTEAGLDTADVLIAVTGSDELNLLCCVFAKKTGHCHAIARVRNPMYSHQLGFIKQQLGISTIINPELTAAREISRLLRFPAASQIDTFADGKVRLIKFELLPEHGLNGVALRDIIQKIGSDILICAAGVKNLITGEMVRPGQVVLDVSMNYDPEKITPRGRGGMVGDCDFASVEPVVEAITPVPGGVGAVTNTVLMKHVIEAAEQTR